jgi:hypothetical protein
VVTPVSVPLPGSGSAEAAVFPRISPNSSLVRPHLHSADVMGVPDGRTW